MKKFVKVTKNGRRLSGLSTRVKPADVNGVGTRRMVAALVEKAIAKLRVADVITITGPKLEISIVATDVDGNAYHGVAGGLETPEPPMREDEIFGAGGSTTGGGKRVLS
jgi:hypothetical protein